MNLIVKNSFWNALGFGLPVVVALVAIPQLIHALGADKFGVLTLIWALVSYVGILDLGLGRSLTQHIAYALGEGRDAQIRGIVAIGLLLLLALGVLLGCTIWLAAPWLVSHMRGKFQPQEISNAVRVSALIVPAVITTTGLRGALEAFGAFGAINATRAASGIFTFVGPLAVVNFYASSLEAISWVLLAGRVCALLTYAALVRARMRSTPGHSRGLGGWIRPLVSSGGYMAVSNIISPLIGYVDRFIIASVMSAAAVAYYATPQEIVARLSILPGAISLVLFPVFARSHIVGDEWSVTYLNAIAALAAMVFLVAFPIGLFAPELLALWLGRQFASASSSVLVCLTLGMMVNSVASIPYTRLQGTNQARYTAMIHVAELAMYLPMLIFAARFGLLAVATVWTCRCVLDAIAISYAHQRLCVRDAQGTFLIELVLYAWISLPYLAILLVESAIVRGVMFLLLSSVTVLGIYVLWRRRHMQLNIVSNR